MANRTCKQCDTQFEHVQTGRGRPPVYCPTCRDARVAKPVQAKRGRPRKNDTVIPTLVGGEIKTGDTVVRPLPQLFGSHERAEDMALKYGSKFKVESIIGDLAYVLHPTEKVLYPALLSSLRKVGVR